MELTALKCNLNRREKGKANALQFHTDCIQGPCRCIWQTTNRSALLTVFQLNRLRIGPMHWPDSNEQVDGYLCAEGKWTRRKAKTHRNPLCLSVWYVGVVLCAHAYRRTHGFRRTETIHRTDTVQLERRLIIINRSYVRLAMRESALNVVQMFYYSW